MNTKNIPLKNVLAAYHPWSWLSHQALGASYPLVLNAVPEGEEALLPMLPPERSAVAGVRPAPVSAVSHG